MKAVALDLDGTLLDSDGSISSLATEQLDRWAQQGCRIAVATGRPFAIVMDLLRENGLLEGASYPHCLICESRDLYFREGSTFQPWRDWNQRMYALESALLPKARRLMQALDEPELGMCFFVNSCYLQLQRGFLEMRFDTLEQAEEARLFLDSQGDSTGLLAERNMFMLALRSPEVGKGKALMQAVALWGLGFRDVLVMGDSLNDLDMMHAGFRVATTDNADPRIKELVQQRGGLISRYRSSRGVGDVLRSVSAAQNS